MISTLLTKILIKKHIKKDYEMVISHSLNSNSDDWSRTNDTTGMNRML